MSKQHQLSFAVVADSNALFSKDPSKVVSSKFSATWEECLKLAKLRLLVPDVVRGERLYQLVCVAKESAQNAAKNFETIKKVSAIESPQIPDVAAIRKGVEARFDTWANERGVDVVPVPYDKIDWKQVVQDSVWRVAPFSPATGDNDSEKGFRDCLILNTLGDIVSTASSEQVVFISGDRLLREAAIARFTVKTFAAYEALDGFLSYLKLTKEKMEKQEKELIQKIIQTAPSVFFTPDNSNCVYNKFNVGGLILQQFASQLSGLAQPPIGKTDSSIVYAPVTDEKIFVDDTRFEKSISQGMTWGWRTRLRFVRVFREQPAPATSLAQLADLVQPSKDSAIDKLQKLLAFDETVRIAPFDVLWTAKCQGPVFSALRVVEIRPEPQTQEMGLYKMNYGFALTGPILPKSF